MYKKNSFQQLNLDDSMYNLTDREMRMLKKSWAYDFGNKIFPKINEDSFSVLYSDVFSRPNTPVNILMSALIIKEISGLTDDELIESLMFDIRFQYAMHTTSFKEQPLSDKSLQRFRRRLLAYEATTGIDLVKNCMNDITDELKKLMKINTSLKRMDSFMVASNIKILSRIELLYTCIADMISYLHKNNFEAVIGDELKHYYAADDYNKVIYHSDESSTTKMETLLNDLKTVMELCGNGEFDEVSEYQLLVRVANEQTINENGKLRLKTKDDHQMNACIMQSPYDPEATYREKAGKKHRGYVSNVVESGESGNTLITDYDLKPNIYSDSNFMEEYIEKTSGNETIAVDGAYANTELIEKAKTKNIKIAATNLTGKESKDIYADFEMSKDGTKLEKCANGIKPKKNYYNNQTGQVTASFETEQCKSCPFHDVCHPKMNKKTSKVTLSSKSVTRAKTKRMMKTEEYKELMKYRNGVEAVPSEMRRKYSVDKMPVRGLNPMKLYLGFKLIAHNFKKMVRYLRDECAKKQKNSNSYDMNSCNESLKTMQMAV